VTDTATTVGDFSFEQRQEFAGSIRQQLADLDRDIRDLASQAKSKGGAVSDRAIANIRASRRAVDGGLRRIDAATSANWEQVKEGVNRAVENLNESIEAAQPK
jgi:phage host-nuclease inhibitor protein Gam